MPHRIPIWGLLILLGTVLHVAHAAKPLNVLFIAVDDLRPELGCYGHPVVQTPHIDRLAASGTVFTSAYCQQAVCNPTRASLMTGLRPETLKVFDLTTHFRDAMPEAVTIAEHFRNHGYHSERVGKIFHTGHGNRDDAQSWSRQKKYPWKPRYGPIAQRHLNELRAAARAKGLDLSKRKNQPRGVPWEAPEVDDADLTDGATAAAAIRILEEVQDRPFFVAVGFVNPHLPFVAPKKYWDLYSPDQIQLAEHREHPAGAPSYAPTNWGELRQYAGIPKRGPLSAEQERSMVHGYWAATSYVDALVGQLLDTLDRLQLRERTVVILWGDHGWQLGEHGLWCKHTNYEVATRVPLIISVPGTASPGAKSPALVEFVDIFPSLCEACDLPTPEGLEGLSFLPLVEEPTRPWKSAAFHLYPRTIPGHGRGMGRAIRTATHRLVEWKANKDGYVEYELYDYVTDPLESMNVANDARYASIRARLIEQLHAGPDAALPDAPE